MEPTTTIHSQPVSIGVGKAYINGELRVPKGSTGLVLFAHGSGSSRFSPRNQYVSTQLNRAGLATLLFDLLTPEEEAEDIPSGHLRFNIRLLGDRLTAATDWVARNEETSQLKLGLFGASTGAAAAVLTAVERPNLIKALVSRGGRPDMAKAVIGDMNCPALFIVGGNDDVVIYLNREAFNAIPAAVEKQLKIVPGASHLFEESGKLEEVARLATDWFSSHLK